MAANSTSSPPKKIAPKKKKKTTTKPPPPIQTESTRPETPEKTQFNSTPSKRTKSPGVRVIGNRIYDSTNGKTCHQCRQKTMDFSVSCTNQIGSKKMCPLNICRKCLINRYGEVAEEVVLLGDWKCPRCRNVCNCSFCMKKKGYSPTGPLIHTAKEGGFSSVSNLLDVSSSIVTNEVVKGGHRKKGASSDEEINDEPEAKRMKEEVDDESKDEKKTIVELKEDHNVEIELPQGTELTNIAGVDMPSQDIGHALQLVEFCETFGEVLELKKEEPEILLHELTSANAHNMHESLVVQFHIRLLSLIEEDFGKKYSKESWVEDFKECISETEYPSKESLLEYFNLQPNGYDDLDFSQKLRLLNFLCDEALGTVKLRLWIEERNVEEKKKAKAKLIANREKEKNTKKKVQDEVAKAILARNGIPLSISEQKDLVAKIKVETAQTLANSLELRDMPRESYVIRSQPILLDRNGCKLWKLRSNADKIGILLQDSCYGETITSGEKWFAYNDEEKALVDEYISNSRNFREGLKEFPVLSRAFNTKQ